MVGKKYILATIHRQENTDNKEKLEIIVEAFSFLEMPVVLPLHPRTAACLERFGLTLPSTVKVIDPIGYLDMVQLEKNAALIVTDSGGVQKEAYFHRVPCVTLRNETEWVELVDCGWNKLAPVENPKDIYETIMAMIGETGKTVELYGSGNCVGLISNIIVEKLGLPAGTA